MRRALASRRELLRLLLASPALLPPVSREARALEALLAGADPSIGETPIDDPSDAVNVFDFRTVAERKLSPGHFAFLSTGVDHEVTLRANREGFEKLGLRPRRLVDTRDVDTSLELFGQELSSPIVLAPCGAQRAFHPDAELAVARAAKKRDHLQILALTSSAELEDVVRARGAPVWGQIYASRFWPVTSMILRDYEAAGCPVCVVTVDVVGMNENRDRLAHFRRDRNPECAPCHRSFADTTLRVLADAARTVGVEPLDLISDSLILDWDFVERIRDATRMKVVVKGILTHEDARIAVARGIDGIVVSNHGGRAEDVGISTIEVLPEIVAAVRGRIPVLVDSGFRRGTDVVKALALGADAVCIGRPYLWGLASFGEEGVAAVLALLQRELVMAMKAIGAPRLDAITPAHVRAVA